MILGTKEVLLVMQQSLLGEVSARLRAVTVRISDDHLHFDCYYDGIIDEDDSESMFCVEAEAIAVLPENIEVTHDLHRLDSPLLLPKVDLFVYARRE